MSSAEARNFRVGFWDKSSTCQTARHRTSDFVSYGDLFDVLGLENCVVFRREPLWKISMNTRLQPSIRCTFDTQECILRLLLAESTESKESGLQEVVVYALKVKLCFDILLDA